jgi:hypothetical protein
VFEPLACPVAAIIADMAELKFLSLQCCCVYAGADVQQTAPSPEHPQTSEEIFLAGYVTDASLQNVVHLCCARLQGAF